LVNVSNLLNAIHHIALINIFKKIKKIATIKLNENK